MKRGRKVKGKKGMKGTCTRGKLRVKKEGVKKKKHGG